MGVVLERINAFVWGAPALVLILGVGIWLSFLTGFSQITLFPKAIRHFFSKLLGRGRKNDEVSPYQTLCTALAATVGTGNIAGVAGAIAIGGPGAVFWIWVCALLGMIIKFAEATLAVYFQQMNGSGQYVGGPMYMIEQGLGKRWRWLAWLYCFFGVVAAFGVGNATQVNAVLDGVHTALESFGLQASQRVNVLLGFGLACLTAFLLLGGASRIGRAAEQIVPWAAVGYILLGLGVLIARAECIPRALGSILAGAFRPSAVTGGAIGSMLLALRTGVSRGVFTNEAGMGTASISYASTTVDHPAEQGLMGIIEVFMDTIVICTVTALVILCSGVNIYFGIDEGAALTSRAFGLVYGQWVSIAIAFFLCCFAFATMLGWGLYGARCAQYLLGEKAWKPFVLVQAAVVTVSSVIKTGTVWMLAEILNGLMAIPNLIALAALSPTLIILIKKFKTISGRKTVVGGTNESFHQCKSLRAFSYEKVSPSCNGGGKAGKENLPPKHRSA